MLRLQFQDLKMCMFHFPSVSRLYGVKIARFQNFKISRFQDPHFLIFEFLEVLKCEDCKISRFACSFFIIFKLSGVSIARCSPFYVFCRFLKVLRLQDFKKCISYIFIRFKTFKCGDCKISELQDFKISRSAFFIFSNFPRL